MPAAISPPPVTDAADPPLILTSYEAITAKLVHLRKQERILSKIRELLVQARQLGIGVDLNVSRTAGAA